MTSSTVPEPSMRMAAWRRFFFGASGWRRHGLMLLCGVAATLSLAPFFWWPLMIPALGLLFANALTAPRPRRAFADGWWWGFGFFVSGLYWFACALLVDAAHFAWLIPFAVFGLSGLFALYTGLAGICFRFAQGLRPLAWPVYAALIWTLAEWLRGYLFTGIPWNMTGYVFGASLPSLQAASLLGVHGLTWLAMAIAAAPVTMLAMEGGRLRRFAPSLLALAVLVGICVYGAHRISAHPTAYYQNAETRLIQGNVPQKIKSSPIERIQGLETYAEASHSAKARFVVWSETSMPFPFADHDEWAQRLATLVPEHGLLLTGVVRIEPASPDGSNAPPIRLYNSLQAVDRQGGVLYRYDKRKLVPFGEFVPFRHILPLEKVTPGNIDFSVGTQPGRLEVGDGVSFFPMICYEAIFSELSDGAWPSVMLNVTNDTWFGDSTGPYQHLAMARMRAVEQGVPLLRDANSGVSAVIDPLGRILRSLPLDVAGIIDTPLPKPLIEPTFYGRYGSQILVTLLLISSISCVINLRRSTTTVAD